MASLLLALSVLSGEPLGAGDHVRLLDVGGQARSYRVHVPPSYQADRAIPVVLIFHGAGTNALMMQSFCGMNDKADQAGFVAVYPNGTGVGIFLAFNSGGLSDRMAEGRPDDVEYTAAVLDDVAKAINIDNKRVYATGMSNGGMMCYRLAAELAPRIAAIAPVAGTMAIERAAPPRPVPVLHFHGTADRLVPFDGLGEDGPKFIHFKSVAETIQTWVKINRCQETPCEKQLEDKQDDGTTASRFRYLPQEEGAEVVLIKIEGGGHTWPGQPPPLRFLGKSSRDISANDLIWEFFEQHRMR